MKVDVYSAQGQKSGSVDLPEKYSLILGMRILLHQVLSSQMSNQRANTAAKDRSEVSGGGKKPWAQKEQVVLVTVQAVHQFGVTEVLHTVLATIGITKSFIPRAMKNRALYALLSAKLRDGKILFCRQSCSS